MTGDNRVIQGLWIGRAISRRERLSIKSFLAHGHDYHLYAYGRIRGVPPGVTLKDAREILPDNRIFQYQTGLSAGSYAGFANLFRYKLLLERGGWWADLDMVCLKPFDFDTPHVFASQNSDEGRCVNNCCLKAPPGSAVMKRCFDEASERDVAKLKWGETGPKLLDREVRQLNLEAFIEPPETFCPVDWAHFLTVVNEGQFIAENRCHAIHLWNEMWRLKSFEKGPGAMGVVSKVVNQFQCRANRRFPPTTVMGQLQRRYGVG